MEEGVDFIARMEREEQRDAELGEAFVLLRRFSIRLQETQLEFGPIATERQMKEASAAGWQLRQNEQILDDYEAFLNRQKS